MKISLRIVNRGTAGAELPNPNGFGAEPVFLVLPLGGTEPAVMRALELSVKSRLIAAPPERIAIVAGGE